MDIASSNGFWFYAGTLCFGLVVGWITYRTLRYTKVNGISDIASVIAAVGGASVVGVIGKDQGAFYPYSIGLAIGFFGYLVVAMRKPDVPWLGEKPGAGAGGGGGNVVDPTGRPLN